MQDRNKQVMWKYKGHNVTQKYENLEPTFFVFGVEEWIQNDLDFPCLSKRHNPHDFPITLGTAVSVQKKPYKRHYIHTNCRYMIKVSKSSSMLKEAN